MPTQLERKLGDLLLGDGVVSQEQLEQAAQRQKETGDSMVHTLIEIGAVTEWEMAATLGKQLNVPFITLSHYEIDPDILESIPRDLVMKYRIIPVDRSDDVLTIALSDPTNIHLLDDLRVLTKCQIVPVISFESDINDAIERYYSSNGADFEEALKDITDAETEAARDAMSTSEMTIGGEAEDDAELTVEADDAPVVQLVNLFVSEAIKMRASDIHIEPFEKTVRLRYRIDGVLQEMTPPPKKFQNAIIFPP